MQNPLAYCEPEDLMQFGLIPEFAGRLPMITNLNQLRKEDLIKILTEPQNALIKQYKKLLAMEGIELEFTDGALDALAEKAFKKGTGARGLRSLLENLMLDVMYTAPSQKNCKKCIITEDVVNKKAKVVIEK